MLKKTKPKKCKCPYIYLRWKETQFPTMHCANATNVFLRCQLIPQQPLENARDSVSESCREIKATIHARLCTVKTRT